MDAELIVLKTAKCYDCPLLCNSSKGKVILKITEPDPADELSCMETRAKVVAEYGIPFVN